MLVLKTYCLFSKEKGVGDSSIAVLLLPSCVVYSLGWCFVSQIQYERSFYSCPAVLEFNTRKDSQKINSTTFIPFHFLSWVTFRTFVNRPAS